MRRTRGRANLWMRLAGVGLACAALAGCGEPWLTRSATRSLQPVQSYEEREGDPAALSTLKRVAVLPFEDLTGDSSFDADRFAQSMAAQLAGEGELKVVFPAEVAAAVEAENRAIRRHNAQVHRNALLGVRPAKTEEREASPGEPVAKPVLDPTHNRDDAIKVGRMLGVDAVVTGVATDFDPYYRPRLTATVRVVATGRTEAAAQALVDLVQWGVPRGLGAPPGVLWYRQQVFDTRHGSAAREVYLFARDHHTESRPYDAEIYLRSMDHFYAFVGGSLSKAFLRARDRAAREALDRAQAQAQRREAERQGVLDRVRALVDPGVPLPEAETVVRRNLPDARDHSWRPELRAGAGRADLPQPPTP